MIWYEGTWMMIATRGKDYIATPFSQAKIIAWIGWNHRFWGSFA